MRGNSIIVLALAAIAVAALAEPLRGQVSELADQATAQQEPIALPPTAESQAPTAQPPTTESQTPEAQPPAATAAPPATPLEQPAAPPLEQPAAAPPVDLSRQFSAADAAAVTPTRQAAATNRMAQAPEMFGDSFTVAGISITQFVENGSDNALVTTSTQFPVGGFAFKVSDNNSPLPRDRVYFRFAHFRDVIDDTALIEGPFTNQEFTNRRSLLVHTLGLEKTFFSEMCSVEVRAPFSDRTDLFDEYRSDNDMFGANALVATAGEGNIAVITKCMLYEGDQCLYAGGLGFDTPTGRDTSVELSALTFEYENRAVYLYPYVAALWTPRSDWFHQTFIGVNVPVSEDRLIITDPFAQFIGFDPTTSGDILPPTTIHVDFSSGYWLCQNRGGCLPGIALLGEIHYSGTLGSAQLFDFNTVGGTNVQASGAAAGSLDMVNLSTGVHLQFGRSSSFRISGVIPLADRPFDSEVTAQWTFWF